MARPKKTTTRKSANKKATARGRKAATKTKAKAKSANARAKKANQTKELQIPVIRRPSPNPPPSAALINTLTQDLLAIISDIDDFAANLRALDRMRHNGVGMKRLGFIEAAFRIATKFPQYYPHWLNTAKFQADINLFNAIRSLVEVCRSLEEKAWNINVESADMIYTDALEYYSQVKDAAHRRIDSAESLYLELHGFFNGMGKKTEEEPTKKQLKRDFNALERGTKDGEVGIRNISPKTTGGRREVIDETFKRKASFKDTDEGETTDF